MAARRNYLYHLITRRTAPRRVEPRRSDQRKRTTWWVMKRSERACERANSRRGAEKPSSSPVVSARVDLALLTIDADAATAGIYMYIYTLGRYRRRQESR